jgi:gluconolactonase
LIHHLPAGEAGKFMTESNRWLDGFRLAPEDFIFRGKDLARPEAVMAFRDGSVLASDKRAAVTLLRPDGSQRSFGSGLQLANTFAPFNDGLLVTDLHRGALMQLGLDGQATAFCDSYEGQPIGSVNFLFAGEEPGVAWMSVSTRNSDYRAAISQPIPDGRIFRIDASGVRLAADGLFFPNAMQIDPLNGYFYVVETTAGRIARARLGTNGMPGRFETFGPDPFFEGAYPDGLALDCEGNVWITELARNALVIIDHDGTPHTIFEDPDGKTLNKPTGLAFGGADLSTVYVGSLKMTALPVFRSPVPGMAARHWKADTRLTFG